MANLSITTAWNETAAFVKREAGLILPIALMLLAVPTAALQIAMPTPSTPGELPAAGLWLLLLPLVMIASIVGSVAITYLALRPGSSVAEGLQVGVKRFLPLFLASLLIAIAAIIVMIPIALIVVGGAAATGSVGAATGSVVLLVLIMMVIGVAFWVRIMLMTPVAAAENLGPIALIRRSWELTRGHFWKLLGFVVLMVMVGGVAIWAISAIIGILVFALGGPPQPGNSSFIVMTIVEALLSAIFSAFFVTMVARVYAQLTGSVPKDVFA